ncbi:hypothetical protein DFH06DRAFT_1189643 [Mycena polygramma]|nr:hypothetical protein DFH06DRAFT_1189643 [Mycena polygramma]
MEHVARFPVLLDICCGLRWASSADENVLLIRHLLDISWDELHAAVSPLRPILDGSGLSIQTRALLDAIIQTSMIGRPYLRANICSRLAWGCIRVRKMIDTGRLPDQLWVYSFPWGRFIRGATACPELLSAVREFVPPERWHTNHGREQCCNVMMWLETFTELPWEEINRWRNLLHEQICLCSAGTDGTQQRSECRPGRDICEKRYRKWDITYPECTA